MYVLCGFYLKMLTIYNVRIKYKRLKHNRKNSNHIMKEILEKNKGWGVR